MGIHSIELSSEAVLASRKLFDHLTEGDLIAAGFTEKDINAFSELFHGIKGEVENIEMGVDCG